MHDGSTAAIQPGKIIVPKLEKYLTPITWPDAGTPTRSSEVSCGPQSCHVAKKFVAKRGLIVLVSLPSTAPFFWLVASRTCARLCHVAEGELDQTQFLLGHISVQTTQKYLGCKQKLRVAVN